MVSVVAPTDDDLAGRAAAGDQEALSALYGRYFDHVYDLCARITRDRDLAADVTQVTFMKVMSSLPKRQPEVSFRAWLYTIARNTAIDELRAARRRIPPSRQTEADDGGGFDIVDADRFSVSETVAQAADLVHLVWQAAAGLNPRDYSLLDMHLRKGLDADEIAAALGVKQGNAQVMLTRLRDALEGSVTAVLLARRGRAECPQLDEVLAHAKGAVLEPKVRKAVLRHVRGCEVCSESRRRLVSPAQLFGGLAVVPAPASLRDTVLAHVQAASAEGTERGPERRRRRRRLEQALIVAAAILAGLGLAAWLLLPAIASLRAPAGGPPLPSSVSDFTLHDAATGSPLYARTPHVLWEATVPDSARAWLLAEDQAEPPPAQDVRWTAPRPAGFQLSDGDGFKNVYLWARDASGGIYRRRGDRRSCLTRPRRKIQPRSSAPATYLGRHPPATASRSIGPAPSILSPARAWLATPSTGARTPLPNRTTLST